MKRNHENPKPRRSRHEDVFATETHLSQAGMGPLPLISSPVLALASLVLVNAWRGCAFSMILIYYRDMVTIIRDRVQDSINKGMTLAQVKAARPTRDYDPRYGATDGPWTTDLFVEAVFKSLGAKKK